MKVCFFRHGPALPKGTKGVADEDRPLTAEGRKKTLRAARGLRRLDLGIDLVLSSRLPRALETARLLAEALELPGPRTIDELLPGTPPDRLAGLLCSLKAKAPALVGHEPDLSGAIAHLIGGKQGSYILKKAGLAQVELGAASKGKLLLLVPPSVLRAFGR